MIRYYPSFCVVCLGLAVGRRSLGRSVGCFIYYYASFMQGAKQGGGEGEGEEEEAASHASVAACC